MNSSFLLKRLKTTIIDRWASLLILTIIVSLFYTYFFINRAYVEIDINVQRPTAIKMYWADKNESFYGWEKRISIKLYRFIKHYGFFIGDIRKIHSIRFYPTTKANDEIIIKKISIKQPGMKTLSFTTAKDFKQFIPGWDIKTTRFEKDKGWIIVPSGKTPHFHLLINKTERHLNIPEEVVRFLGVLGGIWLIFLVCPPLVKQYQYVCWMGGIVFILVIVMAVISLDNHHPDERVHIQAADYYTNHWMIPDIDSPEIAHTYSPYGYSRLNTKQICYIISAKFSLLLKDFHLHPFQRYRFFNVALLGIMILMTLRNSTARLLMIPLLMTPQAWYVFSYYNSEAFFMFVNFLAGYQLLHPESIFNRYLQGKSKTFLPALVLGILAATMLFLKKNDGFYILFLGGFIGFSFLSHNPGFTKEGAKKIFLIVCIGLTLVGIRYGVDVKINGFNKKEQILAMSDKKAKKYFNMTTPEKDRSPFIHMKERGITFKEFWEKYNWPGKIINSFYGVYGYMTVQGYSAYYKWMRNTGFLFLAFLAINILIKGNWQERGLLLYTLLCSTGLIVAAGYIAWCSDFQAQGRYLLPILSILAVIISQTERLLYPLIFRSFIFLMFLMSGYNFIFVGLKNITKYGWG
ncbi:MAG: hypothetical protein DSY70_00330 [Desulfobulbus sp.]|nr:MAG: hypothetical protein DSY70_00330 [Desulfobulbus sp.]